MLGEENDGNFDTERREENRIADSVVKESPRVLEEDSPFHLPISGNAAT